MSGSLQRLGRDWRFQLAFTIYITGWAVRWVQSSLDGSASHWNTTAWVATDNIAYFGWGALAGLFLFMIPLFGLSALSVKNGPLGPPDPAFLSRSRPTIMFLAGLTTGAVIWGLCVLVALVVTETKMPWPLIWGIGFGTAVFGWIPLALAAFMAYHHVRVPRMPASTG